jgi:hypothetical protein
MTQKVTTLPQGGAVDHEALREHLREVMASDGLTQKAVFREAEVGESAGNQWLKGTYTGDNETVAHKLQRWLDAHRRRQEAGARMPDAPGWIETPTAGRVYDAISYAHMAGDVVVVYGGAGLGKTETIEHYRRSEPGVWVVTMSPASGSVTAALSEVCHALDIEESGRKQKMQRAILRRMQGRHGVLIIDEAQNLQTSALDQMRALHDQAGVGLVLVGNETVYSGMTGNRAAYLDRLFSRVGKRVKLSKAGKPDVHALAGAWGITDGEAIDILQEIGKKPGALRVVTKTLRLASLFAQGAGEALTAHYIRAAWQELGG